MIPGNHDVPLTEGREDPLAMYEILPIPGAYVFRRPGIKVFETKSGPVQILGIPYTSYKKYFSKANIEFSSFDDICTKYGELLHSMIQDKLNELEEELPTLMMAHASVTGAKFGVERDISILEEPLISLSILRDERVDHVALGHVHKPQQLSKTNNIYYSGSIDRIDFGEEFETKGFMDVELKKKEVNAHFRQLSTRPLRTVKVEVPEDILEPKA